MTNKTTKRRKRAIPGRSDETKKVMVYLYQDEYDAILKAAVRNGQSVSGYMAVASMEKSRREA